MFFASLSSACVTEYLVLILGCFHLKQVTLITAAIQTSSTAANADKIILVEFYHKSVGEISAVYVTGIKQEMMRRD